MLAKCNGAGCRVRNRCLRHTAPEPHLLWHYTLTPPGDIKQRKRGCAEYKKK